jgi:polar amino acid transport system substrate-binding protein
MWLRVYLARLAILCAGLVCFAADTPAYRLVAGELPPFAVERGELAPGALGELAEAMSQRMGSPARVEFFPWQRAITMPLKQSRVAVFPLTRTPEREAQYHWLVKLYRQDFVFIGMHRPHAGQLDVAALRHKRIIVLRGSPHLAVLHAEHFDRVSETYSVDDCLRMVQLGLADAMYGGAEIHHEAIRLAGLKDADFDFSAPLHSGDIWLAGSMDFTAADSAAWQAAKDEMLKDGSYARILRKYGLSAR